MVRRQRIAVRLAHIAGLACVAVACQPGMGTTPAVSPAPPVAVGLPLFLSPEPKLGTIEDPNGRPLTVTLNHDIRDILEEAGFKLAATPEGARGLVVRLSVQRVALIPSDIFIKGPLICGVRLDVTRGDTLLATAQGEAECVSTSSYYGTLPKDAAVALVNAVSHAPKLLAVAESIRPPVDAGRDGVADSAPAQ